MKMALVAGGILALGLACAAPAAADTDERVIREVACKTLDAYPTLGGVHGVVRYLDEEEGLSDPDIGRMLSKIDQTCPEHHAIIQGYLDLPEDYLS